MFIDNGKNLFSSRLGQARRGRFLSRLRSFSSRLKLPSAIDLVARRSHLRFIDVDEKNPPALVAKRDRLAIAAPTAMALARESAPGSHSQTKSRVAAPPTHLVSELRKVCRRQPVSTAARDDGGRRGVIISLVTSNGTSLLCRIVGRDTTRLCCDTRTQYHQVAPRFTESCVSAGIERAEITRDRSLSDSDLVVRSRIIFA